MAGVIPQAPNDKHRTAVDAQDFFRSGVKEYAEQHYGSGRRTFMSVRHDCYVREIQSLVAAGRIRSAVEAGCGPGLMVTELCRAGLEVSAFDSSAAMLALTRERLVTAAAAPVALAEGNIEQAPFGDAAFDLYVSAGVIEYLATDDLMLHEAGRMLRPGGHAIVSVTNVYSPAGYLDWFVEWAKRRDRVRGLLNAVLRRVGAPQLRPRHFRVRRHRPSALISSLERAGFRVVRTGYFHFLPWPRPLDRLFPGLNDALSRRMDWMARTPLRWVGEGFYVVAEKSA